MEHENNSENSEEGYEALSPPIMASSSAGNIPAARNAFIHVLSELEKNGEESKEQTVDCLFTAFRQLCPLAFYAYSDSIEEHGWTECTNDGCRVQFLDRKTLQQVTGRVLKITLKDAQNVATAIRGAIRAAKISAVPVRRGYWGNNIGDPHTVPVEVTGHRGSVSVRLIPAPKGAGVVAARVPKKVLEFAGIEDCYTSSNGHTRTLGNFVKATFDALQKTYGFLSPELWRETTFTKSPIQEFTDDLSKPAAMVAKIPEY